MKDFDKALMLRNIRGLLAAQNGTLEDLEDVMGLTAGSLQRMFRSPNRAIPSFELVWKIAGSLRVSVEWLAEGSGEMAGEDAVRLKDFIDRLFEQTRAKAQPWCHCGEDAMRRILFGERAEKLHPIGSGYYTDLPDGRRLYLNYFNEDCHVDMGGGHYLEQRWLMELNYETPGDSDRAIRRLYDSNLTDSVFLMSSLQTLYREIEQQEEALRLSGDAREMMDRFMAETAPDKPAEKGC